MLLKPSMAVPCGLWWGHEEPSVTDAASDSGISWFVVPFGQLFYSLASSLSLEFFVYS